MKYLKNFNGYRIFDYELLIYMLRKKIAYETY
jgi:hypothetical protein